MINNNRVVSEVRPVSEIKREYYRFPFTAIVGQDLLKRALILNVINPDIGGVLIRGEKGTGKSIAVRGLSEVLPEIEVVTGCRYNCAPRGDYEQLCPECQTKYDENNGILPSINRPIKIVDMPLNITEDRLLGTIDIEKILHQGAKSFEPGLLAEAHRGILYIDEINLLDDAIIDLLLDAAAMGVITIEREEISMSYQSRFILIGSMNPEEGELRPQLLDRFGLQVSVMTLKDAESRMEIVRRTNEFSKTPKEFRDKYEPEQLALKQKIIRAREQFRNVIVAPQFNELISRLSLDFHVDGHRADIIMRRAVQANAAFDGRTEVSVDDVILSAELALPHRMRRLPFEELEFSTMMLRKLVEKHLTK